MKNTRNVMKMNKSTICKEIKSFNIVKNHLSKVTKSLRTISDKSDKWAGDSFIKGYMCYCIGCTLMFLTAIIISYIPTFIVVGIIDSVITLLGIWTYTCSTLLIVICKDALLIAILIGFGITMTIIMVLKDDC